MKGSGLSSSAAFEVLVGTIVSHLYNGGQISPVKVAQISQYAENVYFGKPSGLMDQMASSVGGFIAMRQLSKDDIMLNIRVLREQFGDRAVLRSIHFFDENERVDKVVHALKSGSFEDFLSSVKESGDSSYKYLQNIYAASDVKHQCLSIALNVAEYSLHRKGACRVHGGGFAGTIQAFVPLDMLQQFKMNIERTFGSGSCHVLSVRPVGGTEVTVEE